MGRDVIERHGMYGMGRDAIERDGTGWEVGGGRWDRMARDGGRGIFLASSAPANGAHSVDAQARPFFLVHEGGCRARLGVGLAVAWEWAFFVCCSWLPSASSSGSSGSSPSKEDAFSLPSFNSAGIRFLKKAKTITNFCCPELVSLHFWVVRCVQKVFL